jgi:hypothetical protein
MDFNSRVLILNRNLFWQNHNVQVIIEVNECYIIDPCMISNMYVPLFWSYLVWFGFHVVGLSSMFFVFFFFFLCLILFKNFWVLLVFNLFFGFGLIFGSNEEF